MQNRESESAAMLTRHRTLDGTGAALWLSLFCTLFYEILLPWRSFCCPIRGQRCHTLTLFLFCAFFAIGAFKPFMPAILLANCSTCRHINCQHIRWQCVGGAPTLTALRFPYFRCQCDLANKEIFGKPNFSPWSLDITDPATTLNFGVRRPRF